MSENVKEKDIERVRELRSDLRSLGFLLVKFLQEKRNDGECSEGELGYGTRYHATRKDLSSVLLTITIAEKAIESLIRNFGHAKSYNRAKIAIDNFIDSALATNYLSSVSTGKTIEHVSDLDLVLDTVNNGFLDEIYSEGFVISYLIDLKGAAVPVKEAESITNFINSMIYFSVNMEDDLVVTKKFREDGVEIEFYRADDDLYHVTISPYTHHVQDFVEEIILNNEYVIAEASGIETVLKLRMLD